jgi:mitochondrial fission protein ELM1
MSLGALWTGAPRERITDAWAFWQLYYRYGAQMVTETPSGDPPVIWVACGGESPDAQSACVLGRAVARLTGGAAAIVNVSLRAPWGRLPPRLWGIGGAREGGWPFSVLADRGAGLARPWPDLIIGAGCAPILAALRRIGAGAVTQVGKPGMGARAFDHVVVTGPARARGANVIETLGPMTDIDADALAEASAIWRRRLGHLPRPRVVVAVGGGPDAGAFGARTLEALTQGLVRLAVDGAGLIVTPAPGTPRGVTDRIADALGGVGGWVWSGVGDNPFPGVLGLADATVVTADATGAAIAAAATGKPLFILRVDRMSAAASGMYSGLRAAGIARPFSGEFAHWRYPPLDEAARAAAIIARHLAPARDRALGAARARD